MDFLAVEGTIPWLIILIILLVIEGATSNLTTIWFAIGAIGALASSQMGAGVPVQIIVFILVSFVALLATRPLVKKWRNDPTVPTNGDRNIGRIAQVISTISPEQPGRVRLDGIDWSARLQGDVTLTPNDSCRIVAMESTTLIVEPCNSPAIS